eukprot:1455561-Pyramimonas_sp.AAC.3
MFPEGSLNIPRMFPQVLLFMVLLRILSYTSFHPRLALLTGSITRALDDMCAHHSIAPSPMAADQ